MAVDETKMIDDIVNLMLRNERIKEVGYGKKLLTDLVTKGMGASPERRLVLASGPGLGNFIKSFVGSLDEAGDIPVARLFDESLDQTFELGKDDFLQEAIDDITSPETRAQRSARRNKDKLEELFGKDKDRRGRALVSRRARNLRSGSMLPALDASLPEKQVFDMLDGGVGGTPQYRMSDVDFDQPGMLGRRKHVIRSTSKPYGPEPLGKTKMAKLGKFAKVAGPIGMALMAYELFTGYGESAGAKAAHQKKMLESAGPILNAAGTPSVRGALSQSSALRDIAESGSARPMRPSLELQGILGAEEKTLASMRQKIKPSMTEAYARAGLL